MQTSPLHSLFGVQVDGIDLNRVSAGSGWEAIRDLFERHSLLLFRKQTIDDSTHLKIGTLFGPIEVRSRDEPRPEPFVSKVSNIKDGSTTILPDEQMLNNLKANMLWHTDSIFLPVPALVNVLRAEIVPSEGGETQFVSTRAAFRDMPDKMRQTLTNIVFKHRYSHSRVKVNPDLAKDNLFTMWEDTRWRAIWPNPVTGEDAVYIASHTYGVEGWEDSVAQAFIDEVIAFCTQPEYVYSHKHEVGDVLMWDERATLHRGMPWPFEQPRTLASTCSSATTADGLEAIRP